MTTETYRMPMRRQLLETACDMLEAGKASAAFEMFLRAAKMGSLEAQVNLGNAYASGQGVQQNWEAARHWYKNAARRGQSEGALNLAIDYRNRQNYRLASYWFARAAAMGDEDAKTELRSLQ